MKYLNDVITMNGNRDFQPALAGEWAKLLKKWEGSIYQYEEVLASEVCRGISYGFLKL